MARNPQRPPRNHSSTDTRTSLAAARRWTWSGSVPRLLLAVTTMTVVLAATVSPVAAGDGSWTWPVDGVSGERPAIEDEFDAPESEYGPGHRGIDLATVVGAPVRTVADGVVTFAGRVAGIDVITVDHGDERSTYEPASASVSVGSRVVAGSVIGEVVLGPFHCATPCLHLGRIAKARDAVRRPLAGDYLDPLDRLAGRTHFVLVDPEGPPPVPPTAP